MGENNSKDTIFCTECNAEIPKVNKFCSECGKPVIVEPEKEAGSGEVICPKCHAKVEPGLRFCTECGTKIEGVMNTAEQTTCPKCYADVKPGLRFCTECGTKISESRSAVQPTTCPKCYADVEPGLRFCTECGTSLVAKGSPTSAEINERLRQKRESGEFREPPKDENVENLVESGKSLMKGLGGILNQVKDDLDDTLKSTDSRSYEKGDNGIKPRVKPKGSGYLVCDKCGGSYKLEAGESADDFILECECGGKLEYKQSL